MAETRATCSNVNQLAAQSSLTCGNIMQSIPNPRPTWPIVNGVRHSTPRFRPPPGATDCHVHVFGPASRFPWSPGRTYTPPDATIDSLRTLLGGLGLSRVVVVHPSPYGSDNSCSLDAIATFGDAARGVAVIDPAKITDSELEALHRGGMRGARANLSTAGVVDPAAAWSSLSALADRIAPLGWHLQTFTQLSVIDALAERLRTLPVPLVVDHFGGAKADLGVAQPGFDALLRLVADGRAYVKLSAAYRVSQLADAADVAPLARALIAANPERMLWGSDWPHPGGARRTGASRDEIEPFHVVDDGAALDRLADWGDRDDAILDAILAVNPARLYGY